MKSLKLFEGIVYNNCMVCFLTPCNFDIGREKVWYQDEKRRILF